MRSYMKKFTPVALVLSSIIGSSAVANAATVEEIKSQGYITVATEDNYRPFEFVQDGKSTGYDNDLKALVEKETGLTLEQEIMPWAGILPGVQSGKFDMALSAVVATEQRRKVFDFTTPTAASQTFYATKAGSDIKAGTDLIGKVVGAETGSAFLMELKAYNEKLIEEHGAGVKEIVEYHGYPEAYQDLALGRLDAVVNTDITLRSLMAERPGVFEIGEPVGKPGYKAWAVKEGNAAVLQVVNDALLKIRESGEMYRLQEQWLGTSYEDMPIDVN